jgi:nicotinamidase-related amidase
MKKKILVVVDMQNDFISGSLGSPEAEAIVPYVAEKIRNADENTYIVFTQDTHEKDYLETQEGKKLPVEHCIKDTKGWEINEEILSAYYFNDRDAEVSNRFIEKPTFGSIDLMFKLDNIVKVQHRLNNEVEIEFVGLCTNICVVNNVMLTKAYFPEIPIVVDARGCAGTTLYGHKCALQAMKDCQVEVINENYERINMPEDYNFEVGM